MLKQVSTAVAVIALTASAAWALSVSAQVPLPGVNSAGALDQALGANITVKVNVNTSTGAFRATGKGTVHNLSGRNQTFVNSPISIPNVTVSSSKYLVKRTGACAVTAAGVASLPN